MNIIETDRLILRTWKEADSDIYFQINQDPRVIEYLGGPMTRQEVTDFIEAMNDQFDKNGYTLWAAEEKSTNHFMGFIGIHEIKWDPPFSPNIEIGWRLGSQYWGKGYATEGAMAALKYGFNQCGLKEIISITVPANRRSIRVMEKLGMTRDFSGDFHHTKLPKDHPLSLHFLYRIKNTNI